MPTLLAYTTSGRATTAVLSVASALARTLQLTVEQRPMPAGADVLRDVSDPAVQLAALPLAAGHAARLVTDVVQRCTKPVVVVPVHRGATAPSSSIDRILVPLDGTAASAETVAETVALFSASGADIVVLHVFEKTTVPKFWDQAVHARESWIEEFLSRYCDSPNVRMELRSGTPGESVVDVATSEHADLIALGWAQDLSPGRARTVRSSLAQAPVPVLLLPLSNHGRARKSRGPTAIATAIKP